MEKKFFRDRKDAKYIRPDGNYNFIFPFFINKRTDAEINIYQNLDITNIIRWVDEKNTDLDFKISYFSALSAVFIKTLYNEQKLNRFVKRNRIYSRNKINFSCFSNDLFSDSGIEKILVFDSNFNDTAISLIRKEKLNIFNNKKNKRCKLNNLLEKLMHSPNFVIDIIKFFIKFCDNHDLIPMSIRKKDYNHSSIFLLNMDGLKTSSFHQHLNNFGTNSINVVFGTIRNDKNRSSVDISITIDERIANKSDFVRALKLITHICDNPSILEEKMSSQISIE